MNKLIRENLSDLCDCTIVEEELLVRIPETIMTVYTKESIKSKTTSLERASEFYKYMWKRPEEDFPVLIQALRRTRNDQAANILELDAVPQGSTGDGLRPQPSGTTTTRDAIPFETGSMGPSPVFQFLPSTTNSVLKKFETECIQKDQLPVPYSNEGIRAALIINVLKDRPGAEFDEQKLNATLTLYGFRVLIWRDLTKQGIQNAVSNFKASLVEYKSKSGKIAASFVAIMSHGTGYDWFLSDDDSRLSVDINIVDEFNNKNCGALEGVPKIFLVNVCRGDKVDGPQTDFYSVSKSETDAQPSSSRPSWTDMLICYASYDNHVAYREPTAGTWFIQTFCQTVKENDGMDIRDILDLVATKIGNMTATEGGKQICPYKNVGFVKKFYLKLSDVIDGKLRVTDGQLQSPSNVSIPATAVPTTSSLGSGTLQNVTVFVKVKTFEVAKEICQNADICNEWRDLIEPLSVSNSNFVALDRGELNGTMKSQAIIKKMLDHWVGKTGRDATVCKLMDILKGAGFIGARDLLEDAYPVNRQII